MLPRRIKPLLVRNGLQQGSQSPWRCSSCTYSSPRRRFPLRASFSTSSSFSGDKEWRVEDVNDIIKKELSDYVIEGHSPEADSIHVNPLNKKQGSIAVLGGGLTGLTTAWYLARYAPNAKITIYEASDRLGGWIDTQEVCVRTPDGKEGKVRFERGARAVNTQNNKPVWDDLIFYDLVTGLHLEKHLRATDHRDLVRRFIYYPDHMVDVSGPVLDPLRPLATISSCAKLLVDLLTEPLFNGAVPSVINMLWGPGKAMLKEGKPGETVGDFFTMAFGGHRDLVDNVLSAMMHGIYGGDVWKLAMASSPFFRMTYPAAPAGKVWVEHKDRSLLFDILLYHKSALFLAERGTRAGYMWFQNGFTTLTDALATALKENPNVTIKLNRPVTSVRYHPTTDTVTVRTSKGITKYDKVVSTIFAKTLADITDGRLPSLAKSHAVTIQLVNLWYPTPNLNAPYHGFGYLIPRSVPADQNPEGALGVIFDSDRENGFVDPAGDAASPFGGSDTVPGTKLTVMLGGHLWQDLPADRWPDAAEAARMAKAVVARHLGISEAENDRAVASSKVCRECIPQHDVEHESRMITADDELNRCFKGKLAVAGGSYTPPGVMGSLRSGRDVAAQIADLFLMKRLDSGELKEARETVGPTGLARFKKPVSIFLQEKGGVPYRYNNGVGIEGMRSRPPTWQKWLRKFGWGNWRG